MNGTDTSKDRIKKTSRSTHLYCALAVSERQLKESKKKEAYSALSELRKKYDL